MLGGMDENTIRGDASGQGPAAGADADAAASSAPVSTRRAFLRSVGRKAIYVAPVLVTLSARDAVASPHAASCKPLAGSCDTNDDCCSGNCSGGVCV
jgi:hypothetical protein